MAPMLSNTNRLPEKQSQMTWLHVIVSICSILLVSGCIIASFAGRAYAATSAFPYDGDELKFMTADGGRFGMYEMQDGSWYKYQNGKIVVHVIPKNGTVFCGFYLNADYDDRTSWDESLYCPASSYGGYPYGLLSFELDTSYAGTAWPISQVKPSDPDYVTGTQYYLAVPTLEKTPGYLLNVTFTDGVGNNLLVTQVISGQDATPPADPKRKGYTFAGWDKPYTNITSDTTINAMWVTDGLTYHTVTFVDGWGNTIEKQLVEDGTAAVAPADPQHGGYKFVGWDPESFDSVTGDMTVTAQWLSDEEVTVAAVKEAIAALPSDPTALLRDTYNEGLATAVSAYNALSDDLKGQITADERMHLARCAIASLPSDPYDIASDHKKAVSAAQEVVVSLSADQQAALDKENVLSNRSYGRYLENAVWAIDGLLPINNATLLKAGTYTGQVQSTSSMGKSPSRRNLGFTVKSITVKNGLATAIIEHDSNSSDTLRLGGVEYKNLQTDPAAHSLFEIPIRLNSTFHFSVKGKNATDETDAITYEMTVTADESSMKPDPKKPTDGDDDDDGKKPPAPTPTPTPQQALSASNSGNLSSLLRPSTSSKSDAAKAENESNKPNGSSTREVILDSEEGSSAEQTVDLMPAVAGGSLLSVALGLLGFAIRFVRREAVFI